MSEATQWKTVKAQLAAVDPRRVDNSAGPGTPDVNFGGWLDGQRVEGWVELKWVREGPANPETPLRVDHFTPQQRIWLRRRWKRGGVALLLLQVGRAWFMLDGATAAKHLGNVSLEDLKCLSVAYWSNGLQKESLLECVQQICQQGNACLSPGCVKV